MSTHSAAMQGSKDEIFGIERCHFQTFLFILLGALIASFFAIGLKKEHLYFDEIFSATFARQSLFDLVVSVVRFDAHPPLYYLQLKLWTLVDSGDYWLLLNSVLWSVLAACSVVGLRFGEMSKLEGYAAGVLFAVMPGTVLYAHFVRMYAMETCLAIWLAIVTRHAVAQTPKRTHVITVIVLELSLLYANAGAPVIVLCTVSYGFLLLLERGASLREFSRWLAVQAIAALLAVPAIVNTAIHSAAHPKIPTLSDIPSTIVYLYAGPLAGHSMVYAAALVVFIGAVIYGLANTASRSLTISLVILPFFLAWTLSHLVRPMWLDRVFLFTMPFFAIVSVNSVVDLSRRISAPVSSRVRSVAAGAILAALGISWCVMRFVETDYFLKPHNYRAASGVIGDGLRPGDVVYVPENFSFWGVARYLKGADWGSPLAVQDAAAPDNSERWKSLLAKLGPEWRNRLNLEPRGRTIDVGGSPLVVGWSRPVEIDWAQRVWLVTHESDEFGRVAPFFGGFTEVTQKDFRSIKVHLLERGGPARSETQ